MACEAGRMRGEGAEEPLIRHPSGDTFSLKGRRAPGSDQLFDLALGFILPLAWPGQDVSIFSFGLAVIFRSAQWW